MVGVFAQLIDVLPADPRKPCGDAHIPVHGLDLPDEELLETELLVAEPEERDTAERPDDPVDFL